MLCPCLRGPVCGLDAELLVKLPVGAGEHLEREIDIRSFLLGAARSERNMRPTNLDADSTDILGRELHGKVVRYDPTKQFN